MLYTLAKPHSQNALEPRQIPLSLHNTLHPSQISLPECLKIKFGCWKMHLWDFDLEATYIKIIKNLLLIIFTINFSRKPELRNLAIRKDLDHQDTFCGLSEATIAIDKENKEKALGLKDGRKCKFCHAYLLPTEHDGFCCNNGHIKLPLSDPPALLKEKLKNDKDFKEEIRSYNNSLAMASLGFDELVRMPKWNPTLKFGGKMYHQIGPLQTSDGRPRSFAQMYIKI